MARAAHWVRQIMTYSLTSPLTREAIWASLGEHMGRGPLAVGRTKDVLDFIDSQLIERRGGMPMRALWSAVADYLDDLQDSLAILSPGPSPGAQPSNRDAAA